MSRSFRLLLSTWFWQEGYFHLFPLTLGILSPLILHYHVIDLILSHWNKWKLIFRPAFGVRSKLMRIELSNRERPFLWFIVRARLRTNIVIARYMIFEVGDAWCIALDLQTSIIFVYAHPVWYFTHYHDYYTIYTSVWKTWPTSSESSCA